MTSAPDPQTAQVRTERMATGGEAIARLDDGRVIFVRGALAGESVLVEITQQKKRFARGIASQILEPSPQRQDQSCSHARTAECGGCDWMFVQPDQQRTYKQAIVVEQLQRLGGVEAPLVTSPRFARGHRTTVRCSVLDGRAGYRARQSDRPFAAAECGAVHPGLEELVVDGRFGSARQVTMRIGARTGTRLVITDGPPSAVAVPDDVVVVHIDDTGDAAIREVIAGREWRISAGSFFQTSHAGAQALVEAVSAMVAPGDGPVVDLYAGVGLLGGAATPDRLQCAVESNPSSVNDARHNLGEHVQVVQSRVERWTPTPSQVVIADPARRGLNADGVAVIDATGAAQLVLVSCDPASLGRDTGLLVEQGWRHDGAQVIDMFPDTSRIEVVSSFTR